jgi:hypothetical protein
VEGDEWFFRLGVIAWCVVWDLQEINPLHCTFPHVLLGVLWPGNCNRARRCGAVPSPRW